MEANTTRPAGPALAPLLLHICCGPCATHVIDCLRNRYRLVGFFYNPNIHPHEEFDLRLEAASVVCRTAGVPLWVPRQDRIGWSNRVRGRESDPEGGRRCRLCFLLRLGGTAVAARRASIPWFATTLTISPHKDSTVILRLGEDLATLHQNSFLSESFGRDGGFQQSVRKSKALGLYRQQFCGCRFSH